MHRLHTGVEERHVCVYLYCLLENRASLLTNRHNAVYQFISDSSVSCLSDNIKKASEQNLQRSESLDYPEKQNMQLVSCKHQSLAIARCSHTVTVTTDSMAQTG